MQTALTDLRAFDLQSIDYPAFTEDGTPVSVVSTAFSARWKILLLAWSNNLSTRYFSHARTLPVTMGP